MLLQCKTTTIHACYYRVKNMATQYKSLRLTDLCTDMLLNVCRYLGKHSLCCLAQVCKSLRFILYESSMWRDVILSISTVDDSTVDSLRIRKITAVKIRECKCVAQKNSPEEDFIESMVLGSKALLYLRQRDQLVGLPRFENLSSLLAHLDCKADLWESFRVESSLVRLIRYLPNLKQLYINHCCHPSQLSSDTFHSIRDILPNLTDFEYSGVNTDHIYMISIPITSSMDQVPYVRGACFKSLERLAGVSLDLRADNEIDWLSEFFPNVRHLELGVSDFDLGDLVMKRAELDRHTLMNICSVTLAISPG